MEGIRPPGSRAAIEPVIVAASGEDRHRVPRLVVADERPESGILVLLTESRQVRSSETDAAPTLAKGLARIARGDTRFIASPSMTTRRWSARLPLVAGWLGGRGG
jgi:hypothetical protein